MLDSNLIPAYRALHRTEWVVVLANFLHTLDELLEEVCLCSHLVGNARHFFKHPDKHVLLVLLNVLKHHVHVQHVVEQHAPSVRVAVAFLAHCLLQERGAVHHCLAINRTMPKE